MAATDQYTSMDGPSRLVFLNWVVILTILGITLAACSWRLTLAEHSEWETHGREAELPVWCFNTAVAVAATIVLVVTLMDRAPLTVKYKVMGRPEVPIVEYTFSGYGKWTTFTLWSNTVGMVYFWCAAVIGAQEHLDYHVPRAFRVGVTILWEITFPIAFFVNLVVSFVLIPGIKRVKDFVKLYDILRWRPQALHNGFVIVAALEAAVAHRPVALAHIPVIILFATSYVIFSWGLFAQTGVYHYFFLDPRFKFAPFAFLALVTLLASLYCMGSLLVGLAAHSWLAGGCIVLAALSTCTWGDVAAVPPVV